MPDRQTAQRDPMSTEIRIGETLRELRRKQGLSLQNLAGLSGVSVGMISQVERGLANPSVRILTALRRALNIPMQELFGQDGAKMADTPDHVRRKADRKVIDLGGIRKELLTPPNQTHLQLTILHLEPGAETGGRAMSYPAEKGGIVLEGTINLQLDDQTTPLETGDSFVFDSARPHSLSNIGALPARVLWIIGAVQFDRHL